MKGNTLSEATTEARPQFKDDLQKMQFDMLNEMIVKRNGLVGKANAAHGDRQTLTEQIRENDTDPAIVEAREQMSKWSEKLNALVKPKVDAVIADAAGSVESVEAEIKEIDGTLKPGLNYYKKLYADDTVELFATQERLKGTTIRGGAGGRRIRGYDLTVTIDGEDRTFENFTQTAKHLDVETADLQSAFFAAAGTEDAKSLPPTVKFSMNITETDGDGNEETKEAFVEAVKRPDASGSSDTASATGQHVAETDENSADDEAEDESDPFEDE